MPRCELGDARGVPFRKERECSLVASCKGLCVLGLPAVPLQTTPRGGLPRGFRAKCHIFCPFPDHASSWARISLWHHYASCSLLGRNPNPHPTLHPDSPSRARQHLVALAAWPVPGLFSPTLHLPDIHRLLGDPLNSEWCGSWHPGHGQHVLGSGLSPELWQ